MYKLEPIFYFPSTPSGSSTSCPVLLIANLTNTLLRPKSLNYPYVFFFSHILHSLSQNITSQPLISFVNLIKFFLLCFCDNWPFYLYFFDPYSLFQQHKSPSPKFCNIYTLSSESKLEQPPKLPKVSFGAPMAQRSKDELCAIVPPLVQIHPYWPP